MKGAAEATTEAALQQVAEVTAEAALHQEEDIAGAVPQEVTDVN